MRKATLSLFVLLLALSAHSFGQTPQWKVVKEFHAYGQTQIIPRALIFTPESKGLYRACLALSGFTNVMENTGYSAGVEWTDITGNSNDTFTSVVFQSGSQTGEVGPQVMALAPGAPVYFYVEASPPPTDATYDVVYTIEKLTN
jgi:hypothetical protein